MKIDTRAGTLLLFGTLALAGCGGGDGSGSGGGGAPGGGGGDGLLEPPSTPQHIESNETDNAYDPELAVDANGNVIVTWRYFVGTVNNIWANRYTPDAGWGTAQPIQTDATESARAPRIAAGGDGDAIAVWPQNDGDRNNIVAARYTPDGGWGMATLIEGGSGNAVQQHVATDGNGNFIAVWRQSDGLRNNLWATRYTKDGGWSLPQMVETDDGEISGRPSVAMDGDGNAVVAWAQQAGGDGSRYNVWHNRYTPGGGWGTASALEISNVGSATDPVVAMDAEGNTIVAWARRDASYYNLRARRRSASVGAWVAPIFVETAPGHALGPQLGFDAEGNAMIVWYQGDGGNYDIYASRYVAGGPWQWETPTLLENAAGAADAPDIAVDPAGNAVAVWRQMNGDRSDIRMNRHTPDAGWGEAEAVEQNEGDAYNPHVVADVDGRFTIVWQQKADASERQDIWARRLP